MRFTLPAFRTLAQPSAARLAVALGLSALVHAGVIGLVASLVWTIAGPPAPSGERDRPADVFLLAVEPPTAAVSVPVPAAAPPEPERPPPPAPAPPVPRRVDAERAGARLPAVPDSPPAPRRARPLTGTLAQSPPPSGTAPVRPAASASIGVAFAGLEARRAESVVYVVDTSGPMVTTLPLVLAEVRRSVAALAPEQRFGVVLCGDGGEGVAAARVFASVLSPATPRAGAQLREWLKGTGAAGRSNPLEGLRAALALEPQVVFLLSRSIARTGGGQWSVQARRTLEELERLNPVDAGTGRRRTIIKAIQFLEDDPTGLMQAIAAAHGSGAGTRGGRPALEDYRVLSAEELAR